MKKLITKMRKREAGSALLATLMVMVGLSLLSLAFVAITETESTISTNARDYSQTHAIAEAGARVAMEWFQAPSWANSAGILPPNENAIKTQRTISNPVSYTGRYKDSGGLLFDKPFKPLLTDRFYGDEEHADVIINATTLASSSVPNFLTTLNQKLFSDTSGGQITDIRVYAPPMSGATLTSGFYNGGVRYGVATIKVTAARFSSTGALIAQRWVKIVVSEWPFPGPQGPVQSNANISTGGNVGVHWGRMTSERDMYVKRPLVGLPWYDAWESLHFEHGYYAAGFDSLGNANAGSGFRDQYDWLYLLQGKSLDDPWAEARAKGTITNAIVGSTTPQPFTYNALATDVTTVTGGLSSWFQGQDHDDGPPGFYKLVVFPKIDYEFWKNISQAASSTNTNVHYLKWVSDDLFTDGTTTKKFAKWVNAGRSTLPAKPGFYFFDTRNSLNPQGPGAPGVLTPEIDLQSSDDGSTFVMKGFIYLNAESFSSFGIGGPDAYFNFPGEPYRDIGYRHVDTVANAYDGLTCEPGKVCSNNGKWDYQDINGNGRCDINLEQRSVASPAGGAAVLRWLPKEWYAGCTVGFDSVAGANCSEPHEPFLNIIYPATACCSGGGSPEPLVIGWEDPGSFTQRPTKKNETTGNPIPCVVVAGNPPDPDCTHNGYNANGPLVFNFGTGGNAQPILDGILYNEGNFDTRGNAPYFGSILINGDIDANGTPEVWFDECLIKGCWQDKFKELPRVYATSIETDQ